MARYSHKGHDSIRYDITQNIAIRYDTIRSESASPYVRTASKQASNTVVLPINTIAAAGAWILADWRGGEATVVGDRRGDRRRSGGRCSLKSRVIQQGFCELGGRTDYVSSRGFGRDDVRHSDGRRRSVVKSVKGDGVYWVTVSIACRYRIWLSLSGHVN